MISLYAAPTIIARKSSGPGQPISNSDASISIAAWFNRSKVRSDLQPHAEVLQLATELADRVLRGASIDEALHEAEFSGRFHRETFAGMWAAPAGTRREALTVPELEVGMTLCEDLRTTKGTVVVPSGTMLTPTLLERIVNFSTGVGVVEPIDVEIADDTPAEVLAS